MIAWLVGMNILKYMRIKFAIINKNGKSDD